LLLNLPESHLLLVQNAAAAEEFVAALVFVGGGRNRGERRRIAPVLLRLCLIAGRMVSLSLVSNNFGEDLG
jgi:hypothetical protein